MLEGEADALGGEDVGVAAQQGLYEPAEAQAAEVVAHLTHAVVLAEVSGDKPAKAFVDEAGDGVQDVAEGDGQGYGACIPEAQRFGSWALSVVGLVDALIKRKADGTALAGSLDHKQPVVDGARLVCELGELVQAGEDVEVRRLVDDGL